MLEASTVEALLDVGRSHGLDEVGVAKAEHFASTQADLEARKAEGLHGGMRFTYRNPARSADPSQALPGGQTLIVGARRYRTQQPASPEANTHGRAARYVWDNNYELLQQGLRAMADELAADGWKTRLLVDDNALVDREAAYRAGLGWYGKNANILLPGQGSWFVLGSLLTDAPIEPAAQPVADGCGPCQRCIDDCPTQAIVAPGVVDARRCLAWLVQDDGEFPVEFRAALGDRLYGCDDCQEVCPPNRKASRHEASSANVESAAGSDVWFDVLAMLEMDDQTLLDTYGRWYIPRRDPMYLRRNALVVLGNVGDGADSSTRSTVERYQAHEEPLLREHADWAASELGL